MNKKVIFIVISTITFVIAVSYIISTSNTVEFHKVKSLKRIDMKDTTLHEICVVVNPPNRLSDFKLQLTKYISKHGKDRKFKNHRIVFVREHPRSITNILLGEKTEYLKRPPAEIAEIDLLAHVEWYTDKRSVKGIIVYYYTQEGRQYGKQGN